jgi:hypothetical protein
MKGLPSRPSPKTLFLGAILLVLVAIVSFSAIHARADVNSYKPVSSLSLPRQHGSAPASASQGSVTLPPGAALPSEAQCAGSIQNSSWEPRPDNSIANSHIPTAQQIAGLSPWTLSSMGLNPKADSLRKQITGNFAGTTDEILQWVACKWGINVNIVRAQAVQESSWHQSQLGDWTTNKKLCPPATWNGKGCYQSYGILQIKYIYNVSAWPMSRNDTAFSAEYAYGLFRACYEGWITYLYNAKPAAGYPRYHAGDVWGCVGRWFSGGWYDQGAINYIKLIQGHLAKQDWTAANF